MTYVRHLGADGWHVGYWDAKGKWIFAEGGRSLTRPKATALMQQLNGGSNAVPDTRSTHLDTAGDLSMDSPT